MRARAIRREGLAHGLSVEGHELVSDEPPEKGGRNEGPTPMQLLASSLAACTAITMEMYAERKGWEIGTVDVCVDFEPDERSSVERFDVSLRLPKDLSEDQVERLHRVAGRCPVHRALSAETSVEIADHVHLV